MSEVLQIVEQAPVPSTPPSPTAPEAPGGERVIVTRNGKTVSIGSDGRVIVRETGTASSGVPAFTPVPAMPHEAANVAYAFFAMIAVVAVGSPLARAFARRMDRKTLPPAPAPAADAERLTRIEQAIESVALEVERIGEGQRYVTQLMAGRDGTPRVGGGAG